MWSTLAQNLRLSFRNLAKNPGFALTAVLTLALGIGSTTAIFSVVYAVFAPMPYPNPDQLVMVWSRNGSNRNSTSADAFLAWQQRSTSFQGIGAWAGGSFNISTTERPEQVPGSLRTPGFFSMEGLPFMLGRDFLTEEAQPGRDHVVILSHRLWSQHFSADRDLIGKAIRMNGEPYTVVGVLPPGFHDRFNSQLWVPLAIQADPTKPGSRSVLVMGRLKDGVSRGQAQAEMDAINAQLQSENPTPGPKRTVSVEPLHLNFLTPGTRTNLWLLLGAVGFLLLIGCVNVANLLLARGSSRQREVALRAALGASNSRLFAQFLTESLVLALLGGALGTFLAGVIIDLIGLVMPPVGTMLPSEADIRINLPVLIFTILITGLSGLLFGSAPAWQATKQDLNTVLKLGGRTGPGGIRRNARRALVIAEFSLALTLLAGGGLALKSFWNLTGTDLGIRTDHVLSFRLPVPEQKLKTPEQTKAYYRQMLERIEAVPGVTKAAAMSGVPAMGPSISARFSLPGQTFASPSHRPNTGVQIVTSGYFDTLGVQLINGRSINQGDTDSSVRVAMVNENFARRFLSNSDPIGQRLMIDEIAARGPAGKSLDWQIVGVYHNVRAAGSQEDYPEIAIPFWQSPWPRVSMIISTANDPKSLIKSLAAAVNSVDPDMPLAGVRTVDEIVDESLSIQRFSAVLFSSFSALGLLLAAVGIYGVMSFGVSQRTHEFGLRMALGASGAKVLVLVLKEGLVLAGVGGLIGLGGAYLVGRAMQATLFGISALDVRAFSAVFLLMMTTALVACLVPALRASRVEPLIALREE